MKPQTDPHMELYHMRLRASRYGTYVQSTESDDGTIIEHMTDGSTIQLNIDSQTGTWMLARFFQENGDTIILYQQHGTYVEESENTGESQ